MFGGFGAGAMAQRMLKEREAAKQLPRFDVTRAEFIRLFMAAGGSPDEAKKQAKISRALGGHTRVGMAMLHVVTTPKKKASK